MAWIVLVIQRLFISESGTGHTSGDGAAVL